MIYNNSDSRSGGANQEQYVCDYLMFLVNFVSCQVMKIDLLITDLVSE